MNFDTEGSKFEKKKTMFVFVGGGGGGGGALTPKLYAKLCHLRSNKEIQLSTYLHNVEHEVKLTFQNLKTLILSSLQSEF